MKKSDIQRHHSNARISKILMHGGLAYLCGQTAKGSTAAESDVAAQTTEVLSRIDTLLAEVGTDTTRLLTATILPAGDCGFRRHERGVGGMA